MVGAPTDISHRETKGDISHRETKRGLSRYGKSLTFIGIISLGLLLSLYFTINNQYIPKNSIITVISPSYPANRSIDMITVTREPLILVPFASVFPDHKINSHLTVAVYHLNKTISSMNVRNVTLSSLMSGSTLS